MTADVIQFEPKANPNRALPSFELLPDPAYTILGSDMLYENATGKVFRVTMPVDPYAAPSPTDTSPCGYVAPDGDCA